MPQFDFTTYSSQIFWFSLCFATLYATMYFTILPRIRNIISERKNIIDADLTSAKALNEKISELDLKTTELRRDAGYKYQSFIDEAERNAAKTREKNIEELKEKIDNLTKKSREEIKDFIAKSQAKHDSIIQDLVQTIKAKILG